MDGSGGDILTGFLLILIVYGLWRLVASGDLGPLLAAVTRFLLSTAAASPSREWAIGLTSRPPVSITPSAVRGSNMWWPRI